MVLSPRIAALILALTVVAPASAAVPRYEGFRCSDPVGHRVTECRLGVHGTPDLSRKGWLRVFEKDVSILQSFTPLQLVPNPAAGGQRDWPLIDSLGLPMGRLWVDPERNRFRLTALTGETYPVIAVNTRGKGCAARISQMRRFTLVQIIAPRAPSSGTQAFLDNAAIDPSSVAHQRFAVQRNPGCGPRGVERGRLRALADPNVGATAHARLRDGTINSVTEYDAKYPFGGTVYFMSNTTSVFVGGITRGMVRVGTPVVKVDRFSRCDPNSDGTLTWNYWSIRTGIPSRPRLYGWIPAKCPKQRAVQPRRSGESGRQARHAAAP